MWRLYDIRLIVERVIGHLFQRVLDEIRMIPVRNVEHRIVPRVRRSNYRLFHVRLNMNRRGGASSSVHHQHHREYGDAKRH